MKDSEFKLKNTNAIRIIISHYLKKRGNDIYDIDGNEENTTPVNIDDETGTYSFIDTHKSKIMNKLIMVDFISIQVLPKKTSIACWNDKHEFDTHPLGCPLRLHVSDTKCYFITEGVFCSLECIARYFRKKRDCKYKETPNLLPMMQKILHGSCSTQIKAASSWKNLRKFGGHQSISEYRRNFGKITFEKTVNMRFVPISTLYADVD